MTRATIACIALICFVQIAQAQHGSSPVAGGNVPPDAFHPSIDVGGLFFISYYSGFEEGAPESNFVVNRGYINVRARVLPWLSGRITPDISVDREGDGEGDLEMRLKYCYVKFDLPSFSVFTQPDLMFGQVGQPWLEFEQRVNRYRVQGSMFVERAEIMNSADFGVTLSSFIGEKLPDAYQRWTSSPPGKYGSFSLGFYNGGGYHAIEQNVNKVFSGRFSLRPLPELLPGLQFTWAGTFGKANVVHDVDWTKQLGYVSLEHERGVLAGTYFTGKGDSHGRAVDEHGRAAAQHGFSVFTELHIPSTPLSIIGRYDTMDLTREDVAWTDERFIVGLVWHIRKGNKILADYDLLRNDDGESKYSFLKISVEFAF